MYRILLSIEPRFVERILNGSKKFEFRKIRCKKEVSKILIYSTSPVMKVVAEADVSEILIADPEEIWKQTQAQSGITKQFFDSYYTGKKEAVAYHLENVRQFSEPKELGDFGLTVAPQSFAYVDSPND